MKKIILMAIAAFAVFSVANAAGDDNYKKTIKERKEINAQSRNLLEAKVNKETKKEVKALQKEGWKVAPGALPLEKMMQRSYELQYEFDDDLMPKYYNGEARPIGESYDAAKMQAMALAKVSLAQQISSEIAGLVENSVDNKQLTSDQAASVVRTLSNSKELIAQKIGRVIPVVEMYRILPNKNYQVSMRVFYKADLAKEAAIEAVRQALEDRADNNQEILNTILKALGK